MHAKGQGISINVVIIAAIALLILVILSVLVFRTGMNVNQGTSCQALGGRCQSTLAGTTCLNPGEFTDSGATCTQSTRQDPYICCRTLNAQQ